MGDLRSSPATMGIRPVDTVDICRSLVVAENVVYAIATKSHISVEKNITNHKIELKQTWIPGSGPKLAYPHAKQGHFQKCPKKRMLSDLF